MSIAQKIASGLNPSSTLAKSASYTILPTDANIFLVTTSSTTRTMTLPAASAVPGRVYRVTKVDSGTGKVGIDSVGSDTMGVNGVTCMELLNQDNYVDLMSDGSSKWLVTNTEMFPMNTTTITTISATSTPVGVIAAWTDLPDSGGMVHSDDSAVLPKGTSRFTTFIQHQMAGDGTGKGFTLHMRKKGSALSVDSSTELDVVYEDPAPVSGRILLSQTQKELDCDGGGIIEYYIVRVAGGGSPTATVATIFNVRGYKLG